MTEGVVDKGPLLPLIKELLKRFKQGMAFSQFHCSSPQDGFKTRTVFLTDSLTKLSSSSNVSRYFEKAHISEYMIPGW